VILTANKDRTHRFWARNLLVRLLVPALVGISFGFDIAASAQSITVRIPLPPSRPAGFGISPEIPAVETPVPVQPIKPKPLPADLPPEELLARINEALTGLKQFSAKFTQLSGNGQQTSGKLTVLRPGRLRFDYNSPSSITIIADGSLVAVIDSRLGTQDVYSIGLTPLKFLLGGTINLARDFKITDVSNEGDKVSVYAEDSSTFGGTSRITLAFDPKTLVLKQWNVVDPQGYEVQVVLTGIDTRHEPDQMLFVIPSRSETRGKN